MIRAKDAVVWVKNDTHEIMVKPREWGVPEARNGFKRGYWCDPIGAAYSSWHEASNAERIWLMLETVIDLTMRGFATGDILRAFAIVPEFRALGSQSFPMCRALNSSAGYEL